MRYTIKHTIPGRLRLKMESLADLAEAGKRCAASPAVLGMRANAACRSLVLVYDPSGNGVAGIFALFEDEPETRKAPLPGTKVPEADSPDTPLSACACAPPVHAPRTKKEFGRFLALGGVLGAAFVKQTLLRGVLAQSLFSPLGLISLLAALPLLKKARDDIRAGRFTLESFLAAGCVAASAGGQALTSLEIQWIQSGAESLNAWVAERSRRSVSGILDLTAKNTFILAGDVEVEIPVSGVKPRDIVVLHTGEKVSVDGGIVRGEALVDDSPITGRAEPAHLGVGDRILAGSYIHQGVVHVRAECVGDKTYLARIMAKVEDSLATRAPIEGVGDRLAKTLVRLGFAATAATFLLTGSAWRAFTVMLVMACPCATSLSAKTAVSAAMSAAAKNGILIKGGRYLEEVGRADIVCFDKTGTLTGNQPRIERIMNFSDLPEDELLLWAYSAEMHNHHPLAMAIKKEARDRGIDPLPHAVCDFTLGKGVKAVIGDTVIRLGNRRYIMESGLAGGESGPETAERMRRADPLRRKGLSVVFLARDETLLAAFGFANEARPDAKAMIGALRASGVSHIAMITGDSKNTAVNFCQELGIEECRHSVLPEEKGRIVAAMRTKGAVIMVGDGINDALALAEADIGIALGATGADVAIEAADIALVHENLADILFLRELGKKTLRIAEQNFALATGTNILGALAGAFGLLSPVMAGFLHIAHTLGVVGNSSRLLLETPADRTQQSA